MLPEKSPVGKASNWKQSSFILPLLGIAILCLALIALLWPRKASHNPKVVAQVSTPTARPTFTSTPIPTATPPATSTPSPPTPTNTRVVPLEVYHTPIARAAKRATGQAENKATAMAQSQPLRQTQATTTSAALITSTPATPATSFSHDSRLVLAHYFAWYDGNGWDNCNISAGDKPLEPYHSDDPVVIARHIQLALDTGLNGFTLHWFAPGDRTDRNFGALLARSEGRNFFSTIVFSRHIRPGAPAPGYQTIGDALRYIINHHSSHPNFLRLDGKPVLLFTDVYRVPTTGESPQQFWAVVRSQIDPQRQMWWIAEGLDASYLSVFDGLYVFKISHAAYPRDYVKSPRWGVQVREWEQRTGQPKLWLATISPGWDDLRAGCQPDVRVPA